MFDIASPLFLPRFSSYSHSSYSSFILSFTLHLIFSPHNIILHYITSAPKVSNRFDADPKRWRMLASISMDLAALIELLTPFFPGYFLPLASIANVGTYFDSHICHDVCIHVYDNSQNIVNVIPSSLSNKR